MALQNKIKVLNCVLTDVCFGGKLTAPPIPLSAGAGPQLSPRLYLHFQDVLFGDDPHLLQLNGGDHILGQHSPCGGERVHIASKAVCYTLSH